MRSTSTYFTKATMLVAVLVMFLSACKKGDEISPAQQQFNTEMETLQAIFKSYGVSAEKVESRMTTKETNIQSVDFSALDLTSMDERLYTIRIQQTIDLRDNQLDMEVINTVKTKFPKVEVLVSGNPPYEQDIELETLEKLGVSADSERVVKNAEGFVSELDLSGMDKVGLDSAIFDFPYLTKLNLANNDLQFHHFQTLKDSIDGIELNFEGNPVYEISMTEIARFQEYLDFNEVKANAEEVLTFYTNDNAVSDEALPEGSSLGYIATIDLSAQNIADLALPTEDFVVLKTDALEIDLSNSSFGLDAMMDEKRVGAIYPTNVEGNNVVAIEINDYLKLQQKFHDSFLLAKKAGATAWRTVTYLPLPFDGESEFIYRDVYFQYFSGGSKPRKQLSYFQDALEYSLECSFLNSGEFGRHWKWIVPYETHYKKMGDLVPSLNSRKDSLVLGIGCYSFIDFDDNFNKLNTKVSFGHQEYTDHEGFWVDSVQISQQALNGLTVRGLTIGTTNLILPDNEINISIYGEVLRIYAESIHFNKELSQAKINLIDGNGQYGDHQKVQEVNLKIASSKVTINIDLSQFPALKRLYIETEGTVNLDEGLLNGIEIVEIKSDNLNK